MLYNPPTGGAVNDPYVGANIPAGIQGSKIPPNAVEYPQRELVALITATGLTPTNTDLQQVLRSVRSGVLEYYVDGGAVNAPAIAPQPPHTALVDGLHVRVRMKYAPTGPTSLTISGLQAPVQKPGAAALAGNEWQPNDVVDLVYNAARNAFQLNGATAAGFLPYYGEDTGTADALVVTLSPSPVTIVEGTVVRVLKGAASNATTTPTLKITNMASGTPQIFNLLKSSGVALAAGDLFANSELEFIADAAGNLRRFGLTASDAAAASGLHSGDDTSTTPNQITVPNLSPPITAYAKYQRHEIKLANAITGPGATVTLSGLGTSRTLVRADGSPVRANDGLAGQVLDVVDDGTYLQIVGLRTSNLPGTGRVYLFASQTWTVPAYVTVLRQVQLWAPGGAGGGSIGTNGAGSAGGSGGYDIAVGVSVTPGQNIVATLGTPGQGSSGANGTAGGLTSFGNIVSATGGGPGTLGSNAIQNTYFGAAGVGSNVPSSVRGSNGGYAFALGTNTVAGGIGGAAIFGGGSPSLNVQQAGTIGNFPGGGGNGGAGGTGTSSGGGGGYGAGPLIIIDL